MNKIKKLLCLLLVLTMCIPTIPTQNVLAYTNISTGDGGGGSGVGSDDWKYTSSTPGVRISIYWAEIPNDFKGPRKDGYSVDDWFNGMTGYFTDPKAIKEGEVKQVGKTIDLAKDSPHYTVEMYSNRSAYEYAKGIHLGAVTGKTGKGEKPIGYEALYSKINPYIFHSLKNYEAATKVKNPTVREEFEIDVYNMIKSMPKLSTSTQSADDETAWQKWLNGVTDAEYKAGLKKKPAVDLRTFENIEILTELMGRKITTEDYRNGIYRNDAGVGIEGVYKVYLEPLLSCVMDGFGTYMTIKDFIAYSDTKTQKEIDKNGKASNDYLLAGVKKLNTGLTFITNNMFLTSADYALAMKTPNTTNYQVKINRVIGSSGKEGPSSVDCERVAKEMKLNGQIFGGMGVGVFSPQRDSIDSGFDVETVKVIKTFVQMVLEKDGTYSYVPISEEISTMSELEVSYLLDAKETYTSGGNYALLNDIITSPIDVTDTENSSGIGKYQVDWVGSTPKSTDGEVKIPLSAEAIWSYNWGISTMAFTPEFAEDLEKSEVSLKFNSSLKAFNSAYGAYKKAKDFDVEVFNKFIKEDQTGTKARQYYSESKEYKLQLVNEAMKDLNEARFKLSQSDKNRSALRTGSFDSLGKLNTDEGINNKELKVLSSYSSYATSETTMVLNNPLTTEMRDSIKEDLKAEGLKQIPKDVAKICKKTKKANVYLRYVVNKEVTSIDLVDVVSGGKKDTTYLGESPVLIYGHDSTSTGIVGFTKEIADYGFEDLEFKGWYVTDGVVQKTIPAKADIKDSGKDVYDLIGNVYRSPLGLQVYRLWELVVNTPEVMTANTVPQWRVSKMFVDDSLPINNMLMSLNLVNSKGCNPYTYLLNGGKYDYSILNSNNQIVGSSAEKKQVASNPWMHVGIRKIKGIEPIISIDNPSAIMSAYKDVNFVKTTNDIGLQMANWVSSNKNVSTSLNTDYAVKSNNKGTALKKASVSKNGDISVKLKNNVTYTQSYGVYGGHRTPRYYPIYNFDGSISIGVYYPCDCYRNTKDLTATYTPSKVNIGVKFANYMASDNAGSVLKVLASKTEANGKTTITKQNSKTLSIYPEVPMLFEDDNKNNSIVFAAGSVARKISLVDYHTLEYSAYVDAKVDPSSTATDSKAKAKAKSIGLGSLPVALKGSNLSTSFDIKKSKNSNEKGTLTVKSYALDIADSSLKSSWGNSSYNPKAAHDTLLSNFNNFSKGTATEQLDIAVPNGTNSAYTGPKVTNKLSYKIKDSKTQKLTLTVRGGVLTEVDGKSLASIKSSNKELYEALVGMKLVGSKDTTVLKTLLSGTGDKLTETKFASLANKARGVSDIKSNSGWYFEDTTTLCIYEYVTTYTLPLSGFPDKIPMSIGNYLKTPIDKSKFYSEMSKGYNILNYTMTSKDLGTGLGTVKVYFEHNSRTDSTYGAKEPAYGVSNTTINESTFGGGF
jgi:hypothetical protein|nr:hypothetical protein [uncultured Lachnoclostridium sp.]